MPGTHFFQDSEIGREALNFQWFAFEQDAHLNGYPLGLNCPPKVFPVLGLPKEGGKE